MDGCCSTGVAIYSLAGLVGCNAGGLIYTYITWRRDLVYRGGYRAYLGGRFRRGGHTMGVEGGWVGGGDHKDSDAFIRVYRCWLVDDFTKIPRRSRYRARRAVVFFVLFVLFALFGLGWRCIIIIVYRHHHYRYLTLPTCLPYDTFLFCLSPRVCGCYSLERRRVLWVNSLHSCLSACCQCLVSVLFLDSRSFHVLHVCSLYTE